MAGRTGRPRVVITGGGTAGHTNPGIAVAQALVELGLPADEIHFVGGRRGNEGTLVTQAGFSIDLLAGRGIERRLTPANLAAAAALLRGLVQGFWLVLRRRPKVVLCLGGYAAFAVSLAAVMLRVPVVVTEQNARASAVNRFIGRWATTCALPFPGTDLPRGVLTGNPTRAEVVSAVADGDAASARARLGLPPDRVVLAVWSGSLGATRVNTVVRELAERWAGRSDLAIRHVVGRRDWARFATPPWAVSAGSLVYQLVEYEDEMPSLLVAADLVLCRSGAATVAEVAIAGLPAVMVPLPHAPRDHQRANTVELVAAGGAVVIDDAELDLERLLAVLSPLVGDAGRREVMSRAAASVARPQAAHEVARLVLRAAGTPSSAPSSTSVRKPSRSHERGPDAQP
jgi:UDP-N-acetylglucosamine--N-acetylmuramyl-(pentapeptide) pyrophosphoryl-undecaprenol N-acetylglucosamine transferase